MIVSLLLAATVLPFMAESQTISSDFQKGTIVTATNEKLDGTIKDQAKNKATILFTSSTGQKKIYTPAELSGFTLNGVNYISFASDFYKVITSGSKASLYQRVTDNSGKMIYNGAEAVVVTTAEGKAGDYYIQTGADSKLSWVTQKNFETFISAAFVGCPGVVADIKNKQLDYTQLNKAVEKYNSCQ